MSMLLKRPLEAIDSSLVALGLQQGPMLCNSRQKGRRGMTQPKKGPGNVRDTLRRPLGNKPIRSFLDGSKKCG
jgi:hypothetical protein